MAHDWHWRKFVRTEVPRLGTNFTQLSKDIGRGPTYVRDIVDGKGGNPPSEPGVENLLAIARKLGVTLEKMVTGQDTERPQIAVIGIAEGDEERWHPPKKDAIAMVDFHIDGGEQVAVEVHGNSLRSAGYRNGDLLLGTKRTGANADNLIGLECIVMTEMGDRYIKYLERGRVRGTFNLRPHDQADDVISDVRVVWAAPVVWVRRRQR